MVETLKLKEENIKKIKENAETRMDVERESLYSTWNSFTRPHTHYIVI